MAATDALATVDMQSIYSVPVVHLGGVVRMHLGEGQAVDTEVMVMRMQRCPYLIDHQQQHQDQSHQQCECAHDSVRWRSVHLGCREWRLLDFHRHVPAIFSQQLHGVQEHQDVRAEVDEGCLNRADPPQQGGGDSQHMHNTDANPGFSWMVR